MAAAPTTSSPPPSLATRALRVLVRSAERFIESEATRLGASFAYYFIFSFFPLLLLSVTVFGYSLGKGDAVRRAFLDSVGTGLTGDARQMVDDAIASIQAQSDARGPAAVFGILALFWGASAVFSELDTALNRIFRVPPPPPAETTWHAILIAVRDRIFAIFIMSTVGLLFFFSLLATLALNVIEEHFAHRYVVSSFLEIGGLAVTFVAITLSTATLFRFVPRKPVLFRYNLAGAALSTAIFSVLRELFAEYLAHFTSYALYGAVGAFLGFTLWTYFSALILFAGAQFAQALAFPDEGPKPVRPSVMAPRPALPAPPEAAAPSSAPAPQKASPAAK